MERDLKTPGDSGPGRPLRRAEWVRFSPPWEGMLNIPAFSEFKVAEEENAYILGDAVTLASEV